MDWSGLQLRCLQRCWGKYTRYRPFNPRITHGGKKDFHLSLWIIKIPACHTAPHFCDFSWVLSGYKIKTPRSPIRAPEVVRRDIKHCEIFKTAKIPWLCWLILQIRSRISIVVTVLTKCNFLTIASSKCVSKWLRQQSTTTTGNRNMAAQTGSTYISRTAIDSVEIPTVNPGFSTMTSSRKCSQMIATTTDYGTV